MLKRKLTRLGLSEKEIKVYLCLVRRGFLPASTLAKRCSLKRATVYSVLDSLGKKNLVAKSSVNGYSHYAALEANNLLYYLNTQMAQLKTSIELAHECVEAIQIIQAS